MQNAVVGQVFAGDFRILRPIGRGGMGTVYLAQQLSTGRKRALKVLNPGLIDNDRLRDQFVSEARIAAELDSDHIVDVVASGFDPATGAPWLASEYLEGETLDARVRRSGRLPPAEVIEIVRQICHGIGQAHAAGLIHRDLKPANLFVADPRRDGVLFTIKVLDFGIAKLTQANFHGGTSAPIGSPLWMAPEQSGPHHALTATDVWPLGLIAYFCLAGRPFWNTDPAHGLTALLTEILTADIPPASERARTHGVSVPAGFDAWFARCVARDPARRFPDAQHALAALAGWEAAAHAPIASGLGAVASRRVTWSGESVVAPGDTSVAPPPEWATSHAPQTLPYPTGDGTFRPLVDSGAPPPATRTKSLLIAGGATVALGAGALVLFSAIGAALYFTGHLPGIEAPPETTSPIASASPTPSPSQSPNPSPSPSPSEPASPSQAASPKPTGLAGPTHGPTATAPGTASPPAASTAASVDGPTPAQIGGFRALVAHCWKNNEGAGAPAPVTVSITVGIDGNGIVRSVRVDNASAYPGLRMCTVRSGTLYRGFRQPPPSWGTTTFSVTLPAAK